MVNTRSSYSLYSDSQFFNANLPAGNYQIVVIGQCLKQKWGSWQPQGWKNNCSGNKHDYDDFYFTNIKLITRQTTNSITFLQRRHIGDSNENRNNGYGGRWYPDKHGGDDVKYEFTPPRRTNLKSITLYNYRDLIPNSDYVKLTFSGNNFSKQTTYMNTDFSSGNFVWRLNKTLLPGVEYELEIEVEDDDDADDISWDDIVIKFGSDTPPSDVINHYRLTYSDRALTCEPAVVTIEACTNNFQPGSACNQSSDSTSVTLVGTAKVGTGYISKPSGNFTGSTDINLGYLQENDLTLSLTGTNKPYKCNGTSNCDINFADTGFFFSYDNADGSDDIANQVAGVNFSKPIKLDAFYNKKGQCKNIFKNNDVIPVKLGVQCQEPNSCSPLNFVANTVNLGKNSGDEESHYSAVNLTFSNHAAQIDPVQYQDAGKINLIASYTINDNRNDLDGLTIKGQSNQFAVRPYQFKIKATRNEGVNGETWADLTARSNHAFKYTHKAGDIFTFKIQALNANKNEDVITLNYVPNSNDNLRIKLTRSMPSSGSFEGQFSYATNKTLLTSTWATWVAMPDLPTFDKGVYRFVDSTYSEVGAIQINVKDNDYYGMQFSVDDNFSANSNGSKIGRFIPSHFELVSSTVDNYIGTNRNIATDYDYVFPQSLASYVAGTTVLQPKDSKVYECRKPPNNGFCVQWSEGSNQFEPGVGSDWQMAWTLRMSPDTGAVFTYMDQPELSFDYRLEARNSAGLVTKNYDGDDKATVIFIANADGRDLSSRLQNYGGAWDDGVYQPGAWEVNMLDSGYFSRYVTGLEDGPMLNTLFGISITDEDSVVLNDLDIPAVQATARMLSIKTSELRYGRWTVADGYGPISNDLATTMQLEYFDGTNFIPHSDDTKTDFDSVNSHLTDISLGGVLPALSGSGSFTNGVTQGLIIAAPNRSGEVQLDYNVDDWFKYKWEESHTGFDQSPSANIVFGFFRGNDRVIYRRRLN
ncbi:DUF6701 domain-containing protein [Moritella yayanosii]|nr:DUF6701 domain-containing protein [Moritella yayanosii]